MYTDVFLLQILLLITTVILVNTFNILSLWYLSGLYLILLGLWLFLDDGDIFIGFLWVIDLGVGLIFFIFILHYSTFTQQKVKLDKSSRQLILIFLILIFLISFFLFSAQPADSVFFRGFNQTWFFLISWYNYYEIFFVFTTTDLNLLKEIYLVNNSFEFFLINFLLFYAIIGSILLSFLIKRIFVFLTNSQYINFKLFLHTNASYFIRNQNFLKQQSTDAGTKVWVKKKFNSK